MNAKYLIIGSGIAGLSAAEQIRKNDADGSILIVSKESMPTYYRIKLTEAIASGQGREELAVKKDDFYEKNAIELKLNSEVESVDFEKKVAHLKGGEEIGYEKLLFATGANPFIPPYEGAGKKNIFSVRTIEDLEELNAAKSEIHSILVVGGGLLGLEAAYSLLKCGLEVYVCEFAPTLLVRQLDEASGKLLQEKLEKEGLKIRTGASIKEALGDGKVEGALMTDGSTLDVDAVLFSVGVRSEFSAAKGLETERGIVVDESLHASAPDVWAAGDCAQVHGMTMGLWTASLEMGKIAGDNMTGKDAKYDRPKLFTNLRIGNVKVFSAGSHDGEMWEKPIDKGFVKLFFNDGVMIGGILYGNTAKMGVVKRLIDERASKEAATSEF